RQECQGTEEAREPALAPNVKRLVVLPMPFRTSAHVLQRPEVKDRSHADLSIAQALPLLMAYVAEGQAEPAKSVFQNALHRREQRQLGYYVLLAAAGVPLEAEAFDVM